MARYAGEDLDHRVERVVGVGLVGVGRPVAGERSPEPLPAPADVPVRQGVEVAGVGRGRPGEVVGVEGAGDLFEETSGLGEDVAVEEPLLVGADPPDDPVAAAVEREEVPAVPDRVEHDAHRLGHRGFLDRDVEPAQHGEESRYQRIVSAPSEAKNSSGSGKFFRRLESLRPSLPSRMPWAMQFENAGRSNSAVASTCIV